MNVVIMEEIAFINRELSWIEFNARVLNEGCRKDLPLFERLKFLGIVTSNFDEFFQVRVASIKRLLKHNQRLNDMSGLTPASLLKNISNRCHELIQIQHTELMQHIFPDLQEAGFEYVAPENYTEEERSFTESFFRHEVFPLLTPLRAMEQDFPDIQGNILHIACALQAMEDIEIKDTGLLFPEEMQDTIGIVQLPVSISRIVYLPSSPTKRFTLLDDIIARYASFLFSGYKIKETLVFKINRDADMAVDEESLSNTNYIHSMEEVLIKRRSSVVVRMVCSTSSVKLADFICSKLNLTSDDVYKLDGVIDPSTLQDITQVENAQNFLFATWKHFALPEPYFNKDEGKTIWETLQERDILLNVPYQSYEPVIRFIQEAANDEKVLSIKITLYRTGSANPIISALKKAARSGKMVTAIVELKARFDEKRNILLGEDLKKAGVTVVYGAAHYKVHAKICLVVRKESEGMRRYVHLSTGNYNPKTALSYQDFSLITANSQLTNDATMFFNVVSGYSVLFPLRKFFMAPVTLKERLLELIEREIKQSTREKPGLIVAKMNSLCHPEVINALYKASQAGVHIMLNVRGVCALVPGKNALSQNIKVISIIDRYLEHSRVIYFFNGGEEELYLSSADWMERNLDRRIELMFPVLDKNAFAIVKKALFLYFEDNTHSYSLTSSGKWIKVHCDDKEKIRVQQALYTYYKTAYEASKTAPKEEFQVRRVF